MPGPPSPRPDEGRDCRQGRHREHPPHLLVPNLPAADTWHGPEPSEQPGAVGVDGEFAAVVPLEPPVPARDERSAFRVPRDPVAVGRRQRNQGLVRPDGRGVRLCPRLCPRALSTPRQRLSRANDSARAIADDSFRRTRG